MVKFYSIVVFAIVLNLNTIASGFEGSLRVMRTSFYDTTYILYHVKQNKVRVEEYTSKKQFICSYIIDLERNDIIAIDPVKKQYKKIISSQTQTKMSRDYEIIKSDNFRYINGYRCNQWRVKNRERNTEIAYWVAKDDFFFFNRMLELINKADKTCTYFLFIPGIQGYMPMLAIERTFLRDEKSRFEVKHIEREKLDNSLFIIPENFRQFN